MTTCTHCDHLDRALASDCRAYSHEYAACSEPECPERVVMPADMAQELFDADGRCPDCHARAHQEGE